MKNKEKIIAFLRKQLNQVQTVHRNLDKLKNKINVTIEELEDESRLGVPVKYDFGMESIKSTEKYVSKQLKKDIKRLRDIQGSTEEIQNKSRMELSSEMEGFTKE